MATLGQAVRAIEEQLFVGRARELAVFERWLPAGISPQPEILNVYGPGGIGKSALLGAFARIARRAGYQVALGDARTFSAAPEEFFEALGGGSLGTVIERLNETQTVLLIDAIEEEVGRDRMLRDGFLSRLDARVRVVLVSRRPLARLWDQADVWHQLIRSLPLPGLSSTEARLYLLRRGLAGRPAMLEQVVSLTRGHPLALALAADLVLRLHIASLEAAPEWHMVVRSLVERVHDTEDSGLRELLEAAAILRQFDEAILLALVGSSTAALTPFARLCDLSIVEPTLDGLTLHEDVRKMLAEDLRWRDPRRYEELRGRAIDYYRECTQRAIPSERARLVCDWLFLSEQHVLRSSLFGEERPGDVRVDTERVADDAAIQSAWQGWLDDQGAVASGTSALNPLLCQPGIRVRVARDCNEHMLGFGASVPVSRATLPFLRQNALVGEPFNAYLDQTGEREPPSIFWHAHVALRGAPLVPTLSALLRDSFELLVQGGVHIACSPTLHHQVALQSLGFDPLPGPGQQNTMQACVLDLTRTGVDSWVDALAAGRRPPRGMRAAEFERELRAILSHWLDDAWLRRSGLWDTSLLSSASRDREPAALRQVVGAALARLQIPHDAEDHLAYRAVELAYLTPRVSNEAAAERLAVSRATFYRLLKRGVRGLAAALSTA